MAPKAWAAIWEAPHRPLFFLAGLWALVAPAVWFLPEGMGPGKIAWHRHELLFGMAGAAAGGYLLTALPAWTKKGPVSPDVTMFATALWCLARLTTAISTRLPLAAAAIGMSAYFVFIAVVLAHGVASSRAGRRLWAPLAMALIGMLSLSWLRGETGYADEAPRVFLVLITLIGGRAVPAFTRSWLERTGDADFVRDRPGFSYLAIAGMVAAAWFNASEQSNAEGLALVVSGLALVLQLRGWQCLRAHRYPALVILHLAYFWTPAALLLIGFATMSPDHLSPATAVHAATMGAMGTMMAALMMRAAMARDEGLLVLGRIMACAFALICLAAMIRILAEWLANTYFDPIVAAATCWMSAWALFLIAYIPALRGPVPRPVLSADRARLALNEHKL
ncbi:NnrS family protein (plasmid) [Ensifer adhaerens]|uniref:NnrS family protein n=1 Tax=Ensifer adhaerens TaxID=106592 RepID=UPI0023A98646|nr:NnrS family protein [Ensifer adhaerens]WDZ81063.1 NnrS family protein [Ensifer adhaerens]